MRRDEASIKVPFHRIQSAKSYDLIECEAQVGMMRAKCLVSCGYWRKLKRTKEDEVRGEIDIIYHLDELIPSFSDVSPHHKIVGLVTYQNGISNGFRDFKEKGEAIAKNFPEGPLSIGLFNPTYGKCLPSQIAGVADLVRLREEWVCNTDTLCCTWRMFATLAELLPKREQFHWLHIAHSEAARIAHLIISENRKTDAQRSFFKKHLSTLTYGAITPISLKHTFHTVNTYSLTDITKKHYAEPLSQNHDYNIKFVPSLVSNPSWIEGDYDFIGNTYKTALKENINAIRTKGENNNQVKIYAKQVP